MHGQERTQALFNHVSRDWDKSVCSPDGHCHSPAARDLPRACMSPATAPGLRLTWVEQDNGSQAPQLRLIHLHVFHFGHQLRQNPARGGAWVSRRSQTGTGQQGWGLKSIWDRHWEYPQFLSAGRGGFEGQPHHTLLFYTSISSIHGPEHQICSHSHFTLFGLWRKFTFTWGKPHGFLSTFHCAKRGHCPYVCQLFKNGNAVSCQTRSRHSMDSMCAVII